MGLPASGKSTFADEIAKTENATIVSSDTIRKEWYGDENIQGNPTKIFEEMRKRTHVIPVRLNAKELRFLEEQVEKRGLSREEYIRSIVMGGEVRARPCEHHAELLRKISGLCNNANQLAHVANGCGMAGEESIREMLRMTKETWRLVKEEW